MAVNVQLEAASANEQGAAVSVRVHGGKSAKVVFDQKAASVVTTITNKSGKARVYSTTPYEVVWCEVKESEFELSFIWKKPKASWRLFTVVGEVEGDTSEAEQWCSELLSVAYNDVKRQRHFRVLVNPIGGQGRGSHIYHHSVEPILKASRCTYDTTLTSHHLHAQEIAKELPLTYDAVITVSGDGLIHEVVNGFAHHSKPRKAFATPISPVPVGSGNGTAINLLGREEGLNVCAAVLNALKGKPMRTDILSVTQGGKRTYSTMTQSIGLMADLDLGTEHLRWMGSKRFLYGFFKGLIFPKECPITLSVKVARDDKATLIEEYRSQKSDDDVEFPISPIDPPDSAIVLDDDDVDAMPPLLHYTENPDEDGWITFDKPLLYAYAGKGPYVGRELMQFPLSRPTDGLLDVVAQELTSRGEILELMNGAPEGKQFWRRTQRYFKAYAYKVTTKSKHGNCSVDGEAFPFEDFHVETHQGLMTFLSPYGRYIADFTHLEPPAKWKT